LGLFFPSRPSEYYLYTVGPRLKNYPPNYKLQSRKHRIFLILVRDMCSQQVCWVLLESDLLGDWLGEAFLGEGIEVGLEFITVDVGVKVQVVDLGNWGDGADCGCCKNFVNFTKEGKGKIFFDG